MQRSRVSHHPCHRLSVPSAKRFWCRHCMMVFEDAITRWRHSRSCRSGGVDSLVRRREIETQSLQKMAETLDPDMMTQITVPREDGSSKDLCCFICRQRFVSLDEMREHVKYPCNKPSSMPRNALPISFFPEPTFGTGIQQHYTDGPVLQSFNRAQASSSSASTSDASAVTVYMNDGEQADSEAKPTNIYVNENGETVIEVENLDLNTKSGELSLAHLLTQLSQQGIVFDHQPQGEAEVVASTQEHATEVDFSQPTAVDAANTLTQLAGSAFRAINNAQDTYMPPVKRIKTEEIELQYHHLEQPHYQQIEHPAHQAQYLHKEEAYAEEPAEKYIICTNESDVIRVMRANDIPPEDPGGAVAFQNGASDVHTSLGEGEVEQAVLTQGHAHPSSSQEGRGTPTESSLTGRQMIVLHDGQAQLITAHADDGSSPIMLEKKRTPTIVHQPVQLKTMTAYAGPEGSVAVMEQQGSVEMIDQQQVVEEDEQHAVMEDQHHVTLEDEQHAVVEDEQHTVVEEQNADEIIEQDTVAVEPEGTVAEIQQHRRQGSVATVVQQDTLSEMQPDITITAVKQGGAVSDHTVAVMQEAGTVVIQQRDTVVMTHAEGTVEEPADEVLAEQESSVAKKDQVCVVVGASSAEAYRALQDASDSAVSGLLEMSGGVPAAMPAAIPPRDCQQGGGGSRGKVCPAAASDRA